MRLALPKRAPFRPSQLLGFREEFNQTQSTKEHHFMDEQQQRLKQAATQEPNTQLTENDTREMSQGFAYQQHRGQERRLPSSSCRG